MSDRQNNIAIVDSGEILTYKEVIAHSDSIAKEAHERTVVLFVASNNIECLLAYIGFLKHRIVPLLVSESIDVVSLEGLLDAYRPEYLWCRNTFFYTGLSAWNFKKYRLWKTGYKNEKDIHDDLALLLSTSGSTGSQKFVRLTYRNIEANAESIAKYLSIQESDKAITNLPFSYSYGLSIINSHLLSGATIILTEHTMFDRGFWNSIKEYNATTFGGVPYTYAMLKQLHFERMSLPSLRYITQAGGRLGKELQAEFAAICQDKNIDFFVMYGQTEGTARLSYLPAEFASKKLGSVGQAIPGGRLFLTDDEGKDICNPYVSGELLYQGDNVSMGYSENRHDLTKGDENKGLLRTGDIAYFDEDGFFSIVGRMKRFLKMFGNRINLDELEHMLTERGFVLVCSGEDDQMSVYVEQGDPFEAQAIIAEKTGLYKKAISVHEIRKIPRNESGKVLYSEL